MKDVRRLIILLALAFTLVLVPAGTAQAKKPLRYGVSGGATNYGWNGTITSGDLNGATMIWVSLILEPNRGEFPPIPPEAVNLYFYEEWFIGYNIAYVGDMQAWTIDGDVVLEGFDEGVTRLKNGKFTGNGRVTDASEDYTHLIGRKEHLSGTVTSWGPPPLFTGTVQINWWFRGYVSFLPSSGWIGVRGKVSLYDYLFSFILSHQKTVTLDILSTKQSKTS